MSRGPSPSQHRPSSVPISESASWHGRVLAGCGCDTKYVFMQLTNEMLELVHSGAGPIPLHDRSSYYDLIAAELRKTSLPTNAAIVAARRGLTTEQYRLAEGSPPGKLGQIAVPPSRS